MSICTYYLNGYIENILFINQKKSSIENNWGGGRGRSSYHKKWWGLGGNHQAYDFLSFK